MALDPGENPPEITQKSILEHGQAQNEAQVVEPEVHTRLNTAGARVGVKINPIEVAAAQRTSAEGLFDKYGRKHSYLRISLTERCNLRCKSAAFLEESKKIPSFGSAVFYFMFD
ncbi:unnamed protein product [Anisakis simplex]|uniref:Uncharacterized protein n=1 Tax=Anisakis simplex TaxID=6269 RepID=A0A0M3JPD6_ANISI|nr:unnamed protein product [Anisakis simplex]